WRRRPEGRDWLRRARENCPEREERMSLPGWLDGREPLSRKSRSARTAAADPEAPEVAAPDVSDEDDEGKAASGQVEAGREGLIDGWVSRLATDAVGDAVALYFCEDVIRRGERQLPLLAAHHGDL